MEVRQDSMTDQLKDLILVANRLGMYDAADFLRDRVDNVDTEVYTIHKSPDDYSW